MPEKRFVDQLLAAPGSVASFDVFDTLVHRRCHFEHVLRGSAARVARAVRAAGHDLSNDDAFQMRLRCAQELFDAGRTAGTDGEYLLTTLLMKLAAVVKDSYGVTLDIHALEAQEVAAEAAVIVPNIAMLELAHSLHGRRTLVATSDMYLGSKHVRTLLDGVGYKGVFDHVFVSGDSGLSKASGRLFLEIADTLGVRPEAIHHIGDGLATDFQGPQKVGARATHYETADARVRQKRHRLTLERRELAVYDFIAEDAPEHPIARYGHLVFGPIYAEFAHRLLDRLEAEGFEHAFFLSRDGFLLKRLADRMQGRLGKHLKTTYMYISRLPVLRALLARGVTWKAFVAAYYYLHPQDRTLARIFAMFGMDLRLVAELAFRYGLGSCETVLDDLVFRDPRLLSLLENDELHTAARAVGEPAKAILQDYLTEIGYFEAPRVALVDIGWSGSIQDQLADVFVDHPRAPRISGFYFATTETADLRHRTSSEIEPVVAHQAAGERATLAGNAAVFSFNGPFEESSRGFHGTTTGYERTAAGVRPTLRDNDHVRAREQTSETRLALLQAGILSFCDAYANAFAVFGQRADEMRPLTRTALARLIGNPTFDEAVFWERVEHTNDIGVLDLMEKLVSRGSGPRVMTPGHLRQLLRTSTWKQGAARVAAGKLGGWVVNLRTLRRYARNVQPAQLQWAKPPPQPLISREGAVRTPAPVTTHDDGFSGLEAQADAFAAEAARVSEAGWRDTKLLSAELVSTLAVVAVMSRLPRKLTRMTHPLKNDGLPLSVVLRSLLTTSHVGPTG